MNPARVGFAGTSAWAADALSRLAGDPSLELALVLTQPDRPAGRGRALRRPAVAERALELDVPVLQPERPGEALDALRDAELGAMAVVASEGAANDALVRLIADALHVAPRQVTLIAGATARIKRLMIEGDGAAMIAKLERVVQAT